MIIQSFIQYSEHILAKRKSMGSESFTALKHSISCICPVCREIINGRSEVQCVNPMMSKHFHYCPWQIWQLLSSNTELQLHLKGVWIETDYLGSDSELSLLSPQCNLLLFEQWFCESKSENYSSQRSSKSKQNFWASSMFHYMWYGTACCVTAYMEIEECRTMEDCKKEKKEEEIASELERRRG